MRVSHAEDVDEDDDFDDDEPEVGVGHAADVSNVGADHGVRRHRLLQLPQGLPGQGRQGGDGDGAIMMIRLIVFFSFSIMFMIFRCVSHLLQCKIT